MTVLEKADPRLTVSYGDFDIDESNGCILSSPYDKDERSVNGTATGVFYIELRVRLTPSAVTGVIATDDAAHAALVNAVESDVTGLRVPRQRLLVQLNGVTICDWNFDITARSAFMIEPQLTLIRESGRENYYGFRVTCQFPGNIPDNVYRRESLTQIGASLRERRTCTLTATWTTSDNQTAYQRYVLSGDDFYESYLPANVDDQYGTTGVWVQASEDPQYGDEISVIQATRVYWETFEGRRQSSTLQIQTINNRRVCTVPVVYVATDGATALQNYTNNGGAFFDNVLPTPVTGGKWVLIDEEFEYSDANETLTAFRTYHEVASGGLREYNVTVTKDAAGIRTVVISGTYYRTLSPTVTAKANYTAGIGTLVTAAVAAESPSIVHYESNSIPAITGYGTTGLTYHFSHTIRELAYPQGSSGWNNTNVTFQRLEVGVNKPYDQQAITDVNTVTRLKTVKAKFTAVIDIASSGGADPATLWSGGLRAHVLTAVITKLGSDVTSVNVVDEDVFVGLDNSVLMGNLTFVVTGGSLLWLKIIQIVTQRPSIDFAPRADGTNFSYHAFRNAPEKTMHREASCEYVVGTGPPVLFGPNDVTVSGFSIVDSGQTAQDSVDAQNATTAFELDGINWHIDRRSSTPYMTMDIPMSRGDGAGVFQTVIHKRVEDWIYVEDLEPGTEIDF